MVKKPKCVVQRSGQSVSCVCTASFHAIGVECALNSNINKKAHIHLNTHTYMCIHIQNVFSEYVQHTRGLWHH